MSKKPILKMLRNPSHEVKIRVVSRPTDCFTFDIEEEEIGTMCCQADLELASMYGEGYGYYIEVLERSPYSRDLVLRHCEYHSELPDWAFNLLPE